jgi:hypothetical protein
MRMIPSCAERIHRIRPDQGLAATEDDSVLTFWRMAKAFRLIIVVSHSISTLLLIKDLTLFNVFMANVFLLDFVLQHIISNLRLMRVVLLVHIILAMIWSIGKVFRFISVIHHSVQTCLQIKKMSEVNVVLENVRKMRKVIRCIGCF